MVSGNIVLNGNYLSGDGGSEGVYVDNSGNVGIGTTSPQAMLDVNAYARLATNASAPVTCDAAHAGSIALTSEFKICACNGTSWVFTHDGTACTW